MDKWIDKIFSLKSFPGKLVFVLWISSLLLVILPSSWLDKFMLTEFKTRFQVFIGPTFLFSTAVTAYMIVRFFSDRVKTRQYIKGRKKSILKHIANLNYNEILVLREFVIQSKDTIRAPFSDETVIALENKGIIYKATQSAVVRGLDMGFPYSITTYAMENLTEAHLNLPVNPSDEDKRRILSERPQWAKNIENTDRLFRDYVY